MAVNCLSQLARIQRNFYFLTFQILGVGLELRLALYEDKELCTVAQTLPLHTWMRPMQSHAKAKHSNENVEERGQGQSTHKSEKVQ